MTIKIYYVQIKGIKENKNCWETRGSFYTLKDARRLYDFYKSGCDKRIKLSITTEKEKIIARKKY